MIYTASLLFWKDSRVWNGSNVSDLLLVKNYKIPNVSVALDNLHLSSAFLELRVTLELFPISLLDS